VAVSDPVDARLLAMLAEAGRVAVPVLAARAGMDPREVAARLTALSGTGLPLVVGAECDPRALRLALVATGVRGAPAAPRPQHTGPSSGPLHRQHPASPSGPLPRQHAMWGPPQTATWARGDQGPRRAGAPNRTGEVGQSLDTEGLQGERLRIRIVEVIDPADFLFTAAGYRLADGERAVVVHSEFTNTGTIDYRALPDQYLVLVATDGHHVSKAPVSLASRPPHRTGVPPGHTVGGHTIYVLPDTTTLESVRWSPRPDDEHRAVTSRLAD